jgi:hypothetical protein
VTHQTHRVLVHQAAVAIIHPARDSIRMTTVHRDRVIELAQQAAVAVVVEGNFPG